MKNATKSLSPLEQEIYFAAKSAKNGIVFLDIIRSWKLTDDATLLEALSKMTKKGWLIRLKNGVYLVSEPGYTAVSDAFAVASYIFSGYLAFSSALYVHKLTDMVPFEVYVATRNRTGLKRIGEYSFRAVPVGQRYTGSETKDDYIISTIPKTIYDCFMRPELAGGYPQILKAIHEAKLSRKDWDEVLYYAEKFETNTFYQRLGYLLDILPRKNKEILRVIKICAKKVKSKIYLYKRKKGKYIPKWKIIDDIGKEELLSWWY